MHYNYERGELMPPFVIIPVVSSVNPLTTLQTMNIGFQGLPFVMGTPESGVDFKTMNIGFQGQPFVIFVGS